mmetsp:Transcript_12418/g.28745  ORF Transcript_12418/g.28745 Transcript_12418/m.28745 type:complete len:150 (-) Transcript_12418:771-1220(-)
MSNRYLATVAKNGNDVFLGSFPTQTQAWIATRKAVGENIPEIPDLESAQVADLQAVSMEEIIDTYEANHNPAIHNFSLHEWTLGTINHYCYQRALKEKEKQQKEDKQEGPTEEIRPDESGKESAAVNKGKRKQTQPRKVDQATKQYISP